ncbi:hypothetical protein DV735_g2284, partial [Chaetothyriales sp. CBS 134920]
MIVRCSRQAATWRADRRLMRGTVCPQFRHYHPAPPGPTRTINEAPRKDSGGNKHGNWWQTPVLAACAVLGIGLALALRGVASQDRASTEQRPYRFAPYELVRRQPVSSTLSIFHLRLSSHDDAKSLTLFQEAWQTGIWNLLLKQPQIQVVRAYTPLPPPTQGHDDAHLRFLIRHDPRGEVSSWLFRLPPGSSLEMKGPNMEFEIPAATRNVTFLAGGTGIAPALQTAHALLSRASAGTPHQFELPDNSATPDLPSIHILWANRQREDCLGGVSDTTKLSFFRGLFSPPRRKQAQDSSVGLVVQELEALKSKYPQQVKVDYFVDEENTRINEESIAQSLLNSSSTGPRPSSLIIVSGPDGFISHFAGPKVWSNGREQQGPVGGVVAQALARVNGGGGDDDPSRPVVDGRELRPSGERWRKEDFPLPPTSVPPFHPVTLLSYLNSALQSYLGLSGTAIPIDVLKTQNDDAWIRIPFEDTSAVIASVSQWSGRSSGGGVQLRVKASGTWLGGLVVASEDEERLWTGK